MGTKKYKGNKNISGTMIKQIRESKHIGKTQLCKMLELEGVNISRDELYKIENNKLLVKDFEIVAISKVLNIDLNTLRKFLEN